MFQSRSLTWIKQKQLYLWKTDLKVGVIANYFLFKNLVNLFLIKLPLLFFYKLPNFKNNISTKCQLLFVSKYDYMSFIIAFKTSLRSSSMFYTIRFKIKGLGLKFKKLTKNLYYFFFNYTNMYYMYIPADILVKRRKKRIILLSRNLTKLKTIFTEILLLKNIGPYRLRGFKYPRQIILLKKKNKKL